MITRTSARAPTLTIGVPAYRNEKAIAATLEAILAQSCGDFRVLISVDVSPDGTGAVCREFAARDSRITYIRQVRNLNYGIFRYLVKAADTEYFMWVAGVDRIGPDFVKVNLGVLRAREDVVLSVSRCLFLSDGVELKYANSTYPLMGSVSENLFRLMYRPDDNTRMYGIFRTAALRSSFPEADFYGYDYALSMKSLLLGKHYEVPDVMMYRDYTPRQSYFRLMFRDGRSVASRLFPAAAFVRDVWAAPGLPGTLKTAVCLAPMNLYHHLGVGQVYHPRYAKLLTPVPGLWDRHVAWRANPLAA